MREFPVGTIGKRLYPLASEAGRHMLGDISYRPNGVRQMWCACVDCGREKWIILLWGKPRSLRCHSCHCRMLHKRQGFENHYAWNGGITRQHEYILVRLRPEDPLYTMTDAKGYAKEHRLVVARDLGRCLHNWELVHHRNGVKDDNRRENLEIVLRNHHAGEVNCPYCERSFRIK